MTRDLLEILGYEGHIAAKGLPAPIQAGKRWPVERTHSWMNGYGKRRAQPSPRSGDIPPPELAIGPCIEVWAADGEDKFDAWQRWGIACRGWCDRRNLSAVESGQLIAFGAPWSVQFLLNSGRRDYVQEKLAKAGATVADVPQLRTAARG